MAPKKASLKGKGHSILLGDQETPEPPPQEEEEVDWAAMLEDEAATAVPPEEQVSPASLPAIEHYYSEELSAEPEPEPLVIGEPAITEPSLAPINSVAPPTPVVAEAEPALETWPSLDPEIWMSREAEEVGPSEPTELQEVDWAAMLEDEVTTAEPPAGEVAPPAIEHYYPPEEPALPESELPPVKKPAVPTPIPTPVSEPDTPPPSEAASQPPPAVPVSPPRVRIGGLLAGVSLEEEVAPPGPGFKEAEVRETTKAPPKELTEDEEEIIIDRVTRKQRRELFDLISQLYRDAPMKLAASGLRVRKEEALLLLSEARDIVLEDPRQFDEAEHKVWQVQAIIANAEDVVRWSHHYGNRLIAYLTIWFAILMSGILFFNPLAAALEKITSVTLLETIPITVPPLLFTMLWGGIGGIIGGLYSLWKHIAEEQDFDKQYTIWYTLQPISGVVLGGIIHVFVLTGFLSMFSQVEGMNMAAVQEQQAVQWFPALLAVVAGFRPNFVYALLSQIVKLIGQASD
jgi:hypothetical protein